MKTPHKNRRQAQKAKKTKGGYCWCDSPESVFVKGIACPICGSGLEQTKRLKKPAPSIEEFLESPMKCSKVPKELEDFWDDEDLK